MKIVFLDIDGVLNSHEFDKTRTLAEEDLVTRNWSGALDPLAIARLNRLIDQSGASIVVSSTWRSGFSMAELRSMLTARGFSYSDRIIDETPHKVGMCRGDEIAEWLGYRTAEGVTHFVILDDGDDMAQLKPSLVRTDSNVGLQDADVDAAIERLESD